MRILELFSIIASSGNFTKFRSPIFLGNDSKNFLSNLNFNHLSEVIKMKKSETITFDDDTLDIYTRK